MVENEETHIVADMDRVSCRVDSDVNTSWLCFCWVLMRHDLVNSCIFEKFLVGDEVQ